MKVSIKDVKDHGVLDNERIVLSIDDNVDIGNYMIADSTYTSNDQLSNKLRHHFWIPDKNVNKDDLVVIYTKKGTSTTKENNSGNKTHFFYWGLETTVWNAKKEAAILFLIDDWTSKIV